MDIKLTVDLSDRTYDLLKGLTLLGGLAVEEDAEKERQDTAKKGDDRKEKSAVKAEPKEAIPTTEVKKEEESVNYDGLRAQARSLASRLKAEGKEVKSALNKYAPKLSLIKNEDLQGFISDLEALQGETW